MSALRNSSGLVLLLATLGVAAAEPAVQSSADDRCFQALQGRLDDLSKRQSRLEDQSTSQGVLSLLNQIEVLQAEVARLRGAQDELDHRQQIADKRQKDVLADFDLRLKETRELEARTAAAPTISGGAPIPVVAAAPVAGDPEAETKAYEVALNRVKAKDYPAATSALNGFLKRYPNAVLAGNALYWLGFSYYAQGDYKNAQLSQQRLLKDYPQHAKAPAAMIGLARAEIQMGEAGKANQVLDQIIAKYPKTEEAAMAQRMQLQLK